jgi:hypothetical protein
MEQQTIQLEAFNTSLHGSKILYPIPANMSSVKYPPWMEWIQKLRDPFRKRIRLSQHAFHFSKHLSLSYDASFQMKDGQDWTLVLTYMTYAPKPLLVIVEDVSVPDGLWQKLHQGITLIHITSQPVIRLHPYDTIFFSPMEEVSASYLEYTHRMIQAVYRGSYSMKEHKEILQELRVAKAGMAWTRVDESSTNGAIYWYDPVSVQPNERLNAKQLADLFGWLTDQFRASHDDG